MQLTQGITQAWTRLSVSARVNLVIASLISVVLVVAMVLIETKPHYVPLFPTTMDTAESNKVQSFLADKGIPFQTADGGQSVLVPIDRRSAAMVELSQQGIPGQVGKGFEVFEQNSMLVNDAQQKVQFQQALAGELMRYLNQFEFVKRSAAFISLPTEELFAQNAQPAKASVTLDLERALSSGEKKALLNAISAFGNGRLSPNDITIMDTKGTPIHVPTDDTTAGMVGSKQEAVAVLEREKEKILEAKLRSMGAVGATVAVSAQIDFTAKTERVNEVTDGAATSTSVESTTITNQPQAVGAPGATSNPPEGVVQGAAQSTKEETKNTLENSMPSTRTTETTTEPGSTWKFVVSAAVDMGHRKAAKGADGKDSSEQEFVPMDPKETEAIRTLLAAATDPNMKPEDVKVFDMPIRIDKLGSVEEARQDVLREAASSGWQQYATMAGKLGVILLGFLVVRGLLKRSMVPVAAPVEESAPIPTASPEEVRKRKVATEVERMSKESPESVAALLRSWLSEAEE
jgi:flagellar M-ring protein FliF